MSLVHAPWETFGGAFAIGLSLIDPADWLEGGELDPASRKDALLAAHPDLVFAETPGSQAGQAEALALVETWAGRPGPGEGPDLLKAARLVADDLCLMQKAGADWRLAALSLCAPSFFDAGSAIGKSLAELHGPVPGFADRFLARTARIFDALRPDLVLMRRNWTLLNSGDLFTPHAAPIRARIGEIAAEAAGEALFLRVERQTIRRLPQTGGVLFTIRVWLAPLATLAAEPARLSAFATAWRKARADFRAYKGLARYDALVEGFLRAAGENYSVNKV